MMNHDPEMVRSRVVEAERGVFVIRELNDGTVDTWLMMVGRLHELTAQVDRWAVILDLTEVPGRPKGEYREAISSSLQQFEAQHIAFVQPGNILLRSVLRFLVSNVTKRSSVHKDFEGALETARRRLAIAVGG